MRLSGLGAIAALGAMLTMPVLAQTTTTTAPPATKPPTAGTATTAPPPAAPKPVTAATPAAKPVTAAPAATTTAAPAAKPVTAAPAATTTAAPAAKPAATPLRLDINTASATELDKIKYVGAKRAAAIIAGRPWKSTDELVTRKVLPKAYYEKVKGNLFVQ